MMTSFPVGLHLRSQMHFSLDFTGGGALSMLPQACHASFKEQMYVMTKPWGKVGTCPSR